MKAANLSEHLARVHHEGRRRPDPRRRRRQVLAGLAAVLVVGVAAFAILQGGERTELELTETGDPAWGDPNATVTAYVFADYQCPACARFEMGGGLDQVLRDWVETGRLRLVYKDLAFIGEDSVTAAQASQVVWAMDPEAWPSWNRYVFEHQGPERSGWADRDGIVALTQAWDGVDMQEFTQRLDAGEFKAEVELDVKEAHDAGVASTPTLVVGSKPVNANDPAAVDQALQEAWA